MKARQDVFLNRSIDYILRSVRTKAPINHRVNWPEFPSLEKSVYKGAPFIHKKATVREVKKLLER